MPPPVPPESAEWHFTENGRASAPVTWTQLRERAASGQLLAGDMVWKDGMANWAAADTILGLIPKQAAAHSHALRAKAYLEQGMLDQSLAEYKAAANLDKQYESCVTSLAASFSDRSLTYVKQGHFEAALADLEKAGEIDPTYSFVEGEKNYRLIFERIRTKLGAAKSAGISRPPRTPAKKSLCGGAPSESWPPGIYYHADGAWHLLPDTDEEFVRLVKSNSITLETPVVRVPDALDPIKFGVNEEAAEAIKKIHQESSGAWSVFKRSVRVGGSILVSALLAPQRCRACRKEIPGSAKRCPYCTEYQ